MLAGMSKPVEVTVDNRTRVRASAIPEEALAQVQRAFTHVNQTRAAIEKQIASLISTKKPELIKLRHQLFARAKGEPKVIPTWRLDQGELSVARGGTAKLRAILEDFDLDITFIDRRVEGSGPRAEFVHYLDPWDFQRQIVAATLEREQGLVRSGTGSGKTSAGIMMMVEAGLCSLVVVWTENLLQQWIRRLSKELRIPASDVGVIQGSTRTIRPITVGMQQTLWNCVDAYRGLFGFVLCDEVHRTAAKTFVDVVDRFPARYRVGMSADERRKDGKEFLLYDTFGEVTSEVTREELVVGGFVVDVEVYLVETGFVCPWYEEIDEAQRPSVFTKLVEDMTGNAGRNRLIGELAREELRRGEQVLIFSHRVEHCRVLRADLAQAEPRVGLLLGGSDEKGEFERCRTGIESGEVRAGVGTYQAVGTALDLPKLARGIATTPIHGNKPFVEQVKGRLCRSAEGKAFGRLYYLWDRSIYGLAPLRNFCRWSKTVRVRQGDQWIEGKAYLKDQQGSRRRREEDDEPAAPLAGDSDMDAFLAGGA